MTLNTVNMMEEGPYTNRTLTVLQVNLCSIRNKLLELDHFCSNEKVDVICATEHWLRDDEVDVFTPQGYISADVVCREVKKTVGQAILLKRVQDSEKLILAHTFLK